MNIHKFDILNKLADSSYQNQRALAKSCKHSLGFVNKAVKELISEGFIDRQMKPTDKTYALIEKNSPKNAVILAAGFGMRMVPINTHLSKGLLVVKGETLIERLIKQLHKAGIYEIYIVVGFMMESYEYLIDKYSVTLVANDDYFEKNNLSSLNCVRDKLSNTYIIPCDIWCRENPFSDKEFYPWYAMSKKNSLDSFVRINRNSELVRVSDIYKANRMIGICYLTEDVSERLKEKLKIMADIPRYYLSFWEEALIERDKFIVNMKLMEDSDVVEINTYEQLRELDSDSNNLQSDVIQLICNTLSAKKEDIINIEISKKGMTNRSFFFECLNKKYIMRIPGEGSDMLVNRAHEAEVYGALKGKGIADNVLYINPDSGYKLAEFINDSVVCDPDNTADLELCMKKLRELHNNEIKVSHKFDIFEKIFYYESLWGGNKSVFNDYCETKEKVFALKPYIDANKAPEVLTHIDAVPDNFLITEKDGIRKVRLIDWEYAGMQDPHVDIAMFCVYSLYNREKIERLIDIYFENNCPDKTRIKIYCYIAAVGLLWSNWCEYKRSMGVEFGEYALRQYRYAKDFYKVAKEELKKINIHI